MGLLERIMGIQTTPDLSACEKRIQRGLDAYRDAGEALKTIRDARLYRAVADTFESYCRVRWRMEPQHAARLIAAADVARNLEPTGEVPKNERAARPLTQLEPAAQVEAWKEAKEAAAPKPPTSRHVAAAVEKRRPKSSKSRPKAIRLRVPGAIVIIEPGRGFRSVEEALTEALSKARGVIPPTTIDKAA